MEKEEINELNKDAPPVSSPGAREQYLTRMRGRLGDETDLESDVETRYGAFLKYDDDREKELGGYKESNKKLADTFSKNPRFAAMMSDVMKGTDASVAFVKYFGQDALDAAGDEEKMKIITEANQEYLNRVADSEKLRKTQEENLQKSEADIEAFQTEKGLDGEAFGKFIDAVYNVVEQGLEGRIEKSFLEIFWKGLNYDKDVEDAAVTGEIEGRNQKIDLENRTKQGDQVPNLNGSNLTKEVNKGTPLPTRRSDFFEKFPTE